MAAIDIILLLIFILTAWLGFRKGIITQIGSVAAIIIAIIACRMFGTTVEDILFGQRPEWDSGFSKYAVSIISNAVIYMVAYYAVILVSRLLHTLTHVVLLAPLDHIAGAAFSVAKYGLLVSLLLNLYIVVFPQTSLLAQSRLADGKAVEAVIGFAPWVLDAINPVNDRQDDGKLPENNDKETDSQQIPDTKTVSQVVYCE